jgi:hypothetical protein
MLYCFSNGKTIPYKGKNKDFVFYREAFFVEIFLNYEKPRVKKQVQY